MTSQSPNDTTPTEDYKNAWSSIQNLVVNEGASWSGREPNRVFLNLGNKQFADVSAISTADYIGDGRSVATLDWDQDGRLDLLLKSRTAPRVRLLRNMTPQAGNFMRLDLRGVTSNRDAIGATVFLEVDGRKLRGTVRAGEGYLAQSSKQLHFGLGTAETINQITVRWPDGTTQNWKDVPANVHWRLEQGAEPTLNPIIPQAVPANAAVADLIADTQTPGRIALTERIPMAPVLLPAFDNPTRRVADLRGTPVLVNLWGTTCAACLKEMNSFAKNAKKIEKVGLKIVTLNTDGEEKHEAAKKMLESFGLLEHAGYADASFMAILEIVLGEVVGQYKGTPLPTSLLLDPNGNLVAIYQGKVPIKMVIRDAGMSKTLDPKNPSLSQMSFGTRLVSRQRNFASMASLFEGLGFDALRAYYSGLVNPAGPAPR